MTRKHYNVPLKQYKFFMKDYNHEVKNPDVYEFSLICKGIMPCEQCTKRTGRTNQNFFLDKSIN